MDLRVRFANVGLSVGLVISLIGLATKASDPSSLSDQAKSVFNQCIQSRAAGIEAALQPSFREADQIGMSLASALAKFREQRRANAWSDELAKAFVKSIGVPVAGTACASLHGLTVCPAEITSRRVGQNVQNYAAFHLYKAGSTERRFVFQSYGLQWIANVQSPGDVHKPALVIAQNILNLVTTVEFGVSVTNGRTTYNSTQSYLGDVDLRSHLSILRVYLADNVSAPNTLFYSHPIFAGLTTQQFVESFEYQKRCFEIASAAKTGG